METSESLNHVVAQTNTLAEWVDGQDAETPVPTCPKWSLVDLVEHVGATQHMVTMLVGEQLADPTPAFARQVTAPREATRWAQWLNDGAARAKDAFDSVTDDAPVWDPSGGNDGVAFWARRLFGEVSVHRADAAIALDIPYELAPEPAAAALEDWLDTMTSAGYWDNREGFADAMRGTGQTLHFHTTDAPGEWLARREDSSISLDRRHGPADVSVSGPAATLLLVMSRRRALERADDIDVQGDPALFDHWLTNMDWVTG